MQSHGLTEYMIELVQIVLPGENGPIRQHLGQDATH